MKSERHFIGVKFFEKDSVAYLIGAVNSILLICMVISLTAQLEKCMAYVKYPAGET